MCTLHRHEGTGTHLRRRGKSVGPALYPLWRRHRPGNCQKSSTSPVQV